MARKSFFVFFIGIVMAGILSAPFLLRAQSLATQGDDIEKQIADKRAEVDRLEKEIETYRTNITKKQGEEKTIASAVALLQQRIKKLNTSIRSLRAQLEEIQLQIRKTKRSIGETENAITDRKQALAEQMRVLDQYEAKRTPIFFIFYTARFTDVLDGLRDVFLLQQKMKENVDTLRVLVGDLGQKKVQLEEREDEQAQLLALQEQQNKETKQKEAEKATLLQQTRTETKRLKNLVELSKGTVESLKSDMYALGKIGVTINDAISLGKLVASRIEVRASFLIAVLEVESRLGLNVGRGTYKKDMNPNQHEKFLALMTRLGMDPDTTPVSKKPSYGWGGAMGPAQFLPGTWLGYEARVAGLTGHNPPSPWNLEDAFMAAGIKLSNDGANAKTRAGELRATKTYLSGNPRCTKAICNSYSNLVLDKADEIEEKLTQ
ncbi:MAG: hypothetical protein Q7S16_01430 [bacterium]|nr:hypothetical protein [bacterium]